MERCSLILRSIVLFVAFVVGQSARTQVFEWEARTPMPEGRWGASTFVIDSVAYVVGGRSGSLDRVELFAYNLGSDTWSEKTPIPAARRLAAAFVLNGKGYISCGLVGTSTKLDDLWEYDPVTNSWSQRADFPGQDRYGTYHFALGGYGYVGGGNIGSSSGPFLSDAFRYDPGTDTWTTAIGLPDLPRHGTSSFVMNGKAYVFGGKESSLAFSPDLWVFDPVTQEWDLLAPFPATPRSSPLAFVFANDAVIGCGRTETVNLYDVWFYDPLSNNWGGAPAYPGESSLAGTSFSINGRAFGGLGWVLETNASASDLWELVKPSSNSILEPGGSATATCHPNPILSGQRLSIAQLNVPSLHAELFDGQGRSLWQGRVDDGHLTLPSGLHGSLILKLTADQRSWSARLSVLPN